MTARSNQLKLLQSEFLVCADAASSQPLLSGLCEVNRALQSSQDPEQSDQVWKSACSEQGVG